MTKQASQEVPIVIENDLYRITFSNRGAEVKSWILKKYDNDAENGPLDLVNPAAAAQYGYPLSLWAYDEDLRGRLSSALYVPSSEGKLKSPATLTFEYADDTITVRKKFTFDNTYIVKVEAAVTYKGAPAATLPAWPSGFGDQTTPAFYASSTIDYQFNKNIERLAIKKISGGGTGASPLSSLKHAGTPWELGLAETQQTLVLNRLRGRIRVQADGQMKTGRDVVIGALLGADEFGFATAPLVVEGCIMMRKCHLNTCPVGVATQDPVLRAKFQGQPEHVVNFFFFVAEEVREIMAQLGIRKFDDLIGHAELLDTKKGIEHWKAKGLDFSRVFYHAAAPADVARKHVDVQDHGLDKALDHVLIEKAKAAIEKGEHVSFIQPVRNVNRTVGAMLSGMIARSTATTACLTTRFISS